MAQALANNWEEKLIAIIESGDVKRTDRHPYEVLQTLAPPEFTNIDIDQIIEDNRLHNS